MGGGDTTGAGGPVRVEVLGPLRLIVHGAPVEVPGPKRRAVLALLARAQGRTVPIDDLIGAVWPAEPPESARASLHTHISRLRGHLGQAAGRLVAGDGGYRLDLGAGGLDAGQASGMLARARQLAEPDPAAACALLREADRLWRGAVLPDLAEVAPIAAWTVTLEELRRELVDCYLNCALAAGEHADLVGVARAAAAADPLREPAVLLLMRVLAATGQPVAAMREGYEYRRRLATEAGLDPSPALAKLEREVASGAAGGASPDREASRERGAGGGGAGGAGAGGAGGGGAGGAGAAAGAAAPPRLLGREPELAALHRLLGHERLVTVVGPGGVGKTSLALALTRQLRPSPAALMLAPVTDPAAVPYALASALDLRVGQGDVVAACALLLQAGPRLLVVDNCEHLREAAAGIIATLLERCPHLTVLTTSREPLELPLECQFRLAPLSVPASDQSADLSRAPSVAVFLDRARRVRRDLRTGQRELAAIRDIVRRLDGMPLAIELAAGRLSSLSLDDLYARLDRALDLLGDDRRVADRRHRTLRATIEWSYQLLAEHEQRLFRHLAVFPDGFDLDTAERVAAELGEPHDPVGVLAHLVDASMINAQFGDRPRYRMLATVRAFGVDRLAATGELRQAEQRLLRWARDLAEWVGATEITDAEPAADAAFRREVPNLRAAWRLARRSGGREDAIRLVAALLIPAASRDLTEIWQWALELGEDPVARSGPRSATVLGMAANAAWVRGELATAQQLAHSAQAVATGDDPPWWGLAALANSALSQGRYAEAAEHAVAAAESATRPTEHYGIAALAAGYAGDLRRARELNQRLAKVAASPTLRAMHAYVAGEIDNAAGEHEPAERHYLRAITLARSAGATFIEGIAAVGLVTVRAAAGRTAEALRGYRELIDYWERTGSWLQQWTTLRNLASLLGQLDQLEPALFLAYAADEAPDAPAVNDAVWQRPGIAGPLPPEVVERVQREAAGATRQRVLDIARQAIDSQLAQVTP